MAITLPRTFRPQVAVRLLSALAVLSALAALWVFAVIAFANAVQLHGVAERLSWHGKGATHHLDRPTVVGVLAFALLVAACMSAARSLVRLRHSRAPRGSEEFVVVPSSEAVAFALPGRPGQIVVSRGMLDALEVDERPALLAHERAHLRLHHHRYVGATEVAASAIPLLRPIARRVHLATERSADEAAARVVGDRSVVARAIAHAALATTASPVSALGLSDTGTVERVEALLADASPAGWLAELTIHVGTAVVVAGLALSAVQVHDWVVRVLGLVL